MPDIRVCSVCHKEFDFDNVGLVEEVAGVKTMVCSEVCAIKSSIGRARACIIIGRPDYKGHDFVSKTPGFGMTNLN